MRRIILSSIACALIVSASDNIVLDSVQVEEKIDTKVFKDVSSEQIKSADLADVLNKKMASVSMVRRSGIANDIILRGAKKDNINVLIDNAKIYGACPNRMDPTTSHVLTNNIESVEVTEGPYDVENFGTLSGMVKVKTKTPEEGIHGDINLNAGSFGYKKASMSINGGNDKIKFLLSASKEESDQYEDGNGNDFLGQQKKNGIPTPNQYSKSDIEAYEKKTLLAKTIINVTDDSEVTLSYTGNRSDNILYANTPMDADYDDSDIYTAKFTQRNLGKYSKQLDLEYYYSKVDHPMSTRNRNNALGSKNKTNNMESSIWGAKATNSIDLAGGIFDLGYDTSIRNWDGYMSNDDGFMFDTIDSTDTKNNAIFSKYEKRFGKLNLETGVRLDDTEIDTDGNGKDRDFNSTNGYVFATYNSTDTLKYFAGAGKATRVPDARELYYKNMNGSFKGNNDLEQTTNYEIDLGFEKSYENGVFKTKVFYSDLKDYIYYTGDNFENVDASIYGIELDGMHLLSEDFSLDYSLAYLKGEKDEPLTGKSDKDLAEIPPLKLTLALTYESGKNKFMTEMIAADKWDNYDEDAKEQELAGYAVFNAKYDRNLYKNLDLTLGVDNIFDKAYASTNTYNDITLIGTGSSETMLMNEPGRYVYVNLKYSF